MYNTFTRTNILQNLTLICINNFPGAIAHFKVDLITVLNQIRHVLYYSAPLERIFCYLSLYSLKHSRLSVPK